MRICGYSVLCKKQKVLALTSLIIAALDRFLGGDLCCIWGVSNALELVLYEFTRGVSSSESSESPIITYACV